MKQSGAPLHAHLYDAWSHCSSVQLKAQSIERTNALDAPLRRERDLHRFGRPEQTPYLRCASSDMLSWGLPSTKDSMACVSEPPTHCVRDDPTAALGRRPEAWRRTSSCTFGNRVGGEASEATSRKLRGPPTSFNTQFSESWMRSSIYQLIFARRSCSQSAYFFQNVLANHCHEARHS